MCVVSIELIKDGLAVDIKSCRHEYAIKKLS